MAGRGSVLNAVDELLRVFDPEAEGERFGFQRHPGSAQHLKRIPGAVPDCQKEDGSRDSDLIVQDGPLDGSLMNFQPCQLGSKSIFRPLLLQIFSQAQDDTSQPVRTEVGSLQVKDFLRGAKAAKGFENESNSRILKAGVEFPIRKSAGSSFPELHVASRVQIPFLPEAINILHPFRDFFSPFDNQGGYPGFHQTQSGKKACRTGSHNDRTLLGPFFDADGRERRAFFQRRNLR